VLDQHRGATARAAALIADLRSEPELATGRVRPIGGQEKE
jgi:hypothetical protein